MLAACEKAEFDRIVRVYLQEVYGYHRIVQTDGKDDCGIDIKVFDSEGQKMQYQMTIQKSSTAQDKSKLKDKIFEDVSKAKTNFEDFGLSDNLFFFYSWELTNKIQREYQKEALTKYGIHLYIVDANQIAEESEEYLSLQQAIYETSGLADFKLKKSLYEDENNNLIYDLVSFGKSSDVKLEIVEAYILRSLYIKGHLTLNDISELCNKKFSTNDNLNFYSKLINRLHSRDKKVNYIKEEKTYELTPEAQKEILKQTEQIKIDEKQFLSQIGLVLSSYNQENNLDEYISLLKEIYIDNFSKRIELRREKEKEKEKEFVLFDKLMHFVKSNISNEDSPKELVRQLINVCDNNKYLQKLCASNIFCKKINIDNLQRYAHEKKQVYIDTTIALHLLCLFYKKSEYKNYHYIISQSLHEYCKKKAIPLFLTSVYLTEVGNHIKEAINLIPFTKLPRFSMLGKSRNVFYNHYCYLKEVGISDGSFEDYLKEFDFLISNDIQTNCQLAESYLKKLGVTVVDISKYYDIQDVVVIIGNHLSLNSRFKTQFALNHDAIMLKYLGDSDVNVHPIDSVFVTWDRTLFEILKEFYKKNPNSSRWMQFTPSQFIDRYSLLSFSIDEETLSKELLALISGDIVHHTVSLIDSLALILNPNDEVGLEYTKRFTKMKDDMIFTTSKIPDMETDSSDNNALDNVVYQIITHYQKNSNSYKSFKGLFSSMDYINDVMKIMEESMKYYVDNNSLGYETFSKFDVLIKSLT